MSYPIKTDLFLETLCFSPQTGNSLFEKLTDCYKQFDEIALNESFSGKLIIKQTIFISAKNTLDFIEKKQELFSCANNYFSEFPPTSIIAQSPDNGSLILEIICMDELKSDELSFKNNEDSSWLVYENNEMKMVISSDLGKSNEPGNVLNQSEKAFTELKNILSEEEMDFSNIVRQWNYIEQITENVHHKNSCSQHYQIFNDVRSKYYQTATFHHGFPAATGIGMDFGGIVIDFIAVKLKGENTIVGIKSPVQLDAYNYSKKVLAENNAMNDFCCTTPKFERAKILNTPEVKMIFISGTAAIKGQKSTSEFSVAYQTEMTIKNILSLIDSENLQKHGILGSEKASLNFLRVYVKYEKDMLLVKEICFKYLADLSMVFVIADICRPELLVEIEGQAIIF